jgi:flagellin
MIINTNISALGASNTLQANQAALSKSLARLSSGNKIINPADDAGGLAVAANLKAEVNRITAAKSNVANGVSFTQTQDGYLQKVGKALDRMSELAIMAKDGTKADADRSLYNQEFAVLAGFITDTASKDFNGVPLFSADVAGLDIPIDPDGNTFNLANIDLTSTTYTDATAATIDTTTNATAALSSVLDAISQLSRDRASSGVSQARLTYAADLLTVSKENLTAAHSRIMDVDVAEESTTFAKQNILIQANTAMLAQANQLPQNILKLLQ